MTMYQIFKHDGKQYSSAPVFTCENPVTVFSVLSKMLTAKYVEKKRPCGIHRIEKRRCPYCDFFDEITCYVKEPSGIRTKIVFTVPFD